MDFQQHKKHVEREMRLSASNVRNIVWPIVAPMLGGGELLSVEEEKDSKLARELDRIAGIDFFQVRREEGMRAIMCRNKYGKNYQAFDIRVACGDSENSQLLKLLRILNKDPSLIFPHLNIQAYLTKREGGQLIEVGIVELVPFVEYLEERLAEYLDEKRSSNLRVISNYKSAGDSNPFIVIPWKELQNAGIEVLIISGPAQDWQGNLFGSLNKL